MWLPWIAALLSFATYGQVRSDTGVLEEGGVLVLTQENFDKVLETNNHVIVEFYAPWCGHCQRFGPEYAIAAQTLRQQQSELKLAKVDSTEHKTLATKYNVKGYPTLILFNNGEEIKYSGKLDTNELVAWAKRKSGLVDLAVKSIEDLNLLTSQNKAVVLGFFKDPASPESKAFRQTSTAFADEVFGLVSEEALFTRFKVLEDNQIIIIKPEEEEPILMTGVISVKTMTAFVSSNILPLILHYNKETKSLISTSTVPCHFLIFASNTDQQLGRKLKEIKSIARVQRGTVLFVMVYTDSEDDEARRVMDWFGISEADIPTFRMTNVQDGFKKYIPQNSEITADNIRGFLSDYTVGRLSPHYKSEKPRNDWNSNLLKELVGSTFEEVALDTTKDVFVQFYAPWCQQCKQLAPTWAQLAQHFKDDEDVVIAQIDYSVNEVQDIMVSGYPALRLFRAGNNAVENYNKARDLQHFINFVRPQVGGDIGEDKGNSDDSQRDEL